MDDTGGQRNTIFIQVTFIWFRNVLFPILPRIRYAINFALFTWFLRNFAVEGSIPLQNGASPSQWMFIIISHDDLLLLVFF